MFIVSPRTLKLLAAFVWYTGGIVLLLKGSSLLLEAEALRPGLLWPWLMVPAALLLGSVKARYLFHKSCRKNLARIDALTEPRPWQCFRPGFFAALAVMIFTGAALSRLANGRYWPLLTVALLDLSISVALLTSSLAFWRHPTPAVSLPAPISPQKKSSPGNLTQ